MRLYLNGNFVNEKVNPGTLNWQTGEGQPAFIMKNQGPGWTSYDDIYIWNNVKPDSFFVSHYEQAND